MHTPRQSVCTAGSTISTLTMQCGKRTAPALAIILMTAVAGQTTAQAQCTEVWRPLNNLSPIYPGVTGDVRAATMWDPDGTAGPISPRLVVGGAFTRADNIDVNNIPLYIPASGQSFALDGGV